MITDELLEKAVCSFNIRRWYSTSILSC